MQFSVFDLTLQKINRTDYNGDVRAIYEKDVNEDSIPAFSSSDTQAELLYSLVTELDPLPFIGTGHDLVFAFGEQEVLATVGKDQSIVFEDLSALSNIEIEDFLTMRLYMNHDAENVLWEYAFDYLSLEVALAESENSDAQCYYVSVDDNQVPMFSVLHSYRNRENPEPTQVKWFTDSSATLEHASVLVDEFGFTINTVTLPRQVSEEPIEVKVQLGDSETYAYFQPFCMTAGKPHSIEVVRDNNTIYRGGIGEEKLTFTIKDEWGNNIKDGTPVSFTLDGGLFVTSSVSATKNGVAEIIVTASDSEVAMSSLTLSVDGDLTENVIIEPQDIEVVISAPEMALTGEFVDIEVSLNPPVEGVDLIIGTNVGRVVESQKKTDGSGVARIKIETLNQPIQGKIRAMAGSTALAVKLFTISNFTNTVSIKTPVMIADEANDGVVMADDGWGNELAISYKTSLDLTVKGTPGEQVELQLGSFSMPVKKALLSYKLNSLANQTAYDQAGNNHAHGSNLTLINEGPSAYQKSFLFIPNEEESLSSKLLATPVAGIFVKQDWQINTAIKPMAQNAIGTVFNIADGIKLSIDEQQKLSLAINTLDGPKVINDVSIPLDEWSNISIKKMANNVQLFVNEQFVNEQFVKETSLSSEMSYNETNLTVSLGGGLHGAINNFALYDLSSGIVALAKFDNGSIAKTVTIDDTGVLTVPVFSTGIMNNTAKIQTVALRVNNDEVHELHFLSKKTHKQIALSKAFSNADYLKYVTQQALLDDSVAQHYQLLPNAYAAGFFSLDNDFFNAIYEAGNGIAEIQWGFLVDEDFWDNVGDGLVTFSEQEIAAFIENADALSDEMVAMVANGDISKTEAAVGLMRVAVMFPPVRRMIGKSVIKPTIKFLKRFKGKKVTGFVADVMTKTLKPAMKGDFDKIFAVAYGLIFLADMMEVISDPDLADLHETVMEIVDGVDSANVLQGIFNFARAALPNLDDSCKRDVSTVDGVQANLINFKQALLPTAHAGAVKQGFGKLYKVINPKAGLKALRSALRKVPKMDKNGKAKPFKLSKFIADIGDTLLVLNVADANGSISNESKRIMESILNDDMLLTLMIVTHFSEAGAVNDFMKGNLPLRTGAINIVSAIAYIESKASEGVLDGLNYQMPDGITEPAELLGREVKWKIRDKYKKIFINVKTKKEVDKTANKDDKATAYVRINGMNGEAFHLIKIASLLAEGKTIIGVESEIDGFELYAKGKVAGPALGRRVDIVSGDEKNAVWHEVKSLAYNTLVISHTPMIQSGGFQLIYDRPIIALL